MYETGGLREGQEYCLGLTSLSLVQSAANLKKVKQNGFQSIFKKSNENRRGHPRPELC